MASVEHVSSEAMLRSFADLHGPDFEPVPQLGEALELAWRASLHVDEGRLARFVLAFGNGPGPREGAKWLQPPVSVGGDPRRLARLSFATDPWRVALHVAPAPEGGLVVTSLAAMPDLATWPDSAGPLVGIEVTAPARVALLGRRGGVLHDHGRLSVHSRADSARLAVSDESIAALLAHGAEPVAAGHRLRFDRYSEPLDIETWLRHSVGVQDVANRIARDVLYEDLRHLAVAIRQRGHGGALLFLPDGTAVDDAEIKDLVTGEPHSFGVESRVSTAGWNGDLLSAFTWRLHVALATELHVAVLRSDALSFLHGRDEKTPIVQWLNANGRVRIHQVEAAWRAQVERVADLCQLDGAVIASILHEPLAMGAFFRLGAEEPLGASGNTDSWALRRGTRHRSMRHVVDQLAGAAGLVVSHDGDVTLYRHGKAAALLSIL